MIREVGNLRACKSAALLKHGCSIPFHARAKDLRACKSAALLKPLSKEIRQSELERDLRACKSAALLKLPTLLDDGGFNCATSALARARPY